MAADRDARVLAMLEEMRMKGRSERGSKHSQEKGKLLGLWSSSSCTSLESEMGQDSHDEGDRSDGEWHTLSIKGDASRTVLGKWGRKGANLRRSISADTLTGSALHLDSGISLGDWGTCPLTGCLSEAGGVESLVAGTDSSDCYLSRLSITSSSCGAAVDTMYTMTNDDTLTKDTVDLDLGLKGEMEGEFPIGHVIPCLGDVWHGPGVKKSQSVTERLQHGSLRATSLRNELLALLGQAKVEDRSLQEAAEELVAFRSCGDAELEAEGERQLLLSRERREAILSKAEAMATCSGKVQEGATPSSTATVTISNLHVTVSAENTPTLTGGSRPAQYCVRDSFLCLVRDTVGGSVAATEVEQITEWLESGSGELVFHSTMRWVEQSPDFKLRVELYQLPAAPPPRALDHSPAQRWRVPRLLSRALSSSPLKSWKRRSSKHRRKGPSQERTGCEKKDCSSVVPSRFSLVGHVEVNADNGGGHLLACLGPGFQIEFDVSFEPEWEEDCALEGFLTVQTVQTGVGWEVLWCRLQGHFLYFWSYPEEVTQRKRPGHHIDLCRCKELAHPASKEVCVRKNAILLSMAEGVSLLVAESRAAQSRWTTALNRVISIALAWKQT